MSIRGIANLVYFVLYNGNRQNANPPLVFPGVNPNQRFTYSIWVKVVNNVPFQLIVHFGTDGSHTVVGCDGSRWFFQTRAGSGAYTIDYFNPVTLNKWALLCFAKDAPGPYFHIYYGVEDDLPNPWERPVTLTHVLSAGPALDFQFNSFYFLANGNAPVCNFKFWNETLDITQLQNEAQRWDAGTAFWATPLRTPGDLASIATPYASQWWEQGHAYSVISPANGVVKDDDPAYMANTSPCPTWVYPTVFTSVFIDPGLTPTVNTTYKGPQFFEFDDRGSIPTLDHQIQSIIYYGSCFGGVDAGTPFNECWGLYKNELGVEIADMSNPDYRFQPGDTAVIIPGPIKASNMYLWKFGGQFVWYAVTPQGPTSTAHLAYLLLLVTYVGYPTGIPSPHAVDMAGLFVIKKGQRVDLYNRGVEMKIPDPMIRTAYIGE